MQADMTTCGYCRKHKGKRTCPALGRICPSCCGEHCGREISCPPDCAYVRRVDDSLQVAFQNVYATLVVQHLACMTNFMLHRRKVFRVDESLAWMLTRTGLDVPRELVQLPFPAFALTFTDRATLQLGESLLQDEVSCAIRGQEQQILYTTSAHLDPVIVAPRGKRSGLRRRGRSQRPLKWSSESVVYLPGKIDIKSETSLTAAKTGTTWSACATALRPEQPDQARKRCRSRMSTATMASGKPIARKRISTCFATASTRT